MSELRIDMSQEEWEAEIARGHAELYPGGCREPGHSCDSCLKRLGQKAHKVDSRIVGRRIGVRLGTVEYRCTVAGCKAVLS